MNLRKRTYLAAVLVGFVLYCASELSAQRFAQGPPEIKAERWQTVNGQMVIDHSGKSWFLVSSYSGPGLSTSFMYCPDDAGKKLPLSAAGSENGYGGSARRSIWVDSQNRAWCNLAGSLCCVDLAKGDCTWRVAETKGLDPRTGSRATFYGAHLENKVGGIYAVDTSGLHFFDGQKWSFECLHDATKTAPAYYSNDSAEYRFVQCPSGQVIFWGPANYAKGFYIHDGTQWQAQPCEADTRSGQKQFATAILPLDGQKAIGLFRGAPHKFFDLPGMARPKKPAPPSMEIAAVILRLGDSDKDKRQKAQVELAGIAQLDDQKALDTAKLVSDAKLQEAAVAIIKKAAATIPAADGPAPAKDVALGLEGASLICQCRGGEFILRGGSDEGFRLTAIFPDGRHELAPADFPKLADVYGGYDGAACPFGDKIVINTNPAVLWDGAKFSLLDLDLIYAGRIVGKDSQGRIYFDASPGYYDSRGSISIFDSRQASTLPALKYQRLVGPSSRNAALLDSKDHVWTRLWPADHPFLSRYDSGKWTDADDPPMFDGSPRLWTDKEIIEFQGNVARISQLRGSSGPYVPREVTRRLPSLCVPSFIQSLRDGLVAAASGQDQAVYLCLHEKWTAYPDIETLVEKNYQELVKAVDNDARNNYQLSGGQFSAGNYLRVDAGGRVWTFLYNNGGGAAYDGKKWVQLDRNVTAGYSSLYSGRFSCDGKRCVTNGMIYDLTVWPPKGVLHAKVQQYSRPGGVQPPVPEGDESEMTNFIGITRKGMVIASDNQGCVNLAGEDLKFNKIGELRNGQQYFEDSGGRLWFWQYGGFGGGVESTLCVVKDGNVVLSTGVQAQLRNGNGLRLVEQDPRTFWTLSDKGFLRIRLSLSGQGNLQDDQKEYSPQFPADHVRNMFIDKDQAMWIVSDLGLFRFELPAADK
jgi:hypothetical protein